MSSPSDYLDSRETEVWVCKIAVPRFTKCSIDIASNRYYNAKNRDPSESKNLSAATKEDILDLCQQYLF